MKINFAHNVYDRPNRLKETIRIEKEIFPDAKIYVAYNNWEIKDQLHEIPGISLIYFGEKTHKIGCVNGAYFSISMAMLSDPDVIIFSHDDVWISNPEIVKKHIENIVSKKYDFIGRIPKNLPDIGTKYMMMEAMFFSPIAAKCIYENFKPFINENYIERDLRGSISPEVNMYNIVHNALPPRTIDVHLYNHGNDPKEYNDTLNVTLGFTHENIGSRGWKE